MFIKRLNTLALAAAALFGTPVSATEQAPECAPPRPPELTFMSRKLYAGADLAILDALQSPDAEEFARRVPTIRTALAVADAPARMALLAEEVLAVKPDFIGIQEAIVIRGQEPGDGTETPATVVELDLLEVYLAALAERGLFYEVVTSASTLDVEFASADGRDLRYTDGVAILMRTDLGGSVALSAPRSALLSDECVLPLAVGPLALARGWAAVDVALEGAPQFSVFVSHLDFTCIEPGDSIQRAQAAELELATRGDTPVVLIADLNSSDGVGDVAINADDAFWQEYRQQLYTPTYPDLIAAGFTDAWPEGVRGYNCCYVDDLVSLERSADLRVDYILHRGAGFTTVRAGNTGLTETTAARMRPSNHAGTWVTLRAPAPSAPALSARHEGE